MRFNILRSLFLFFIFAQFISCKFDKDVSHSLVASGTEVDENQPKSKPITPKFKEYWYSGKAEVTSYKLEQARYGEMRDGNAVLIYVTEPFEVGRQVKADRSDTKNVSILKLNSTKKFQTGIYPYSIMSSTFYPVKDNSHALKITNSVQEWCGQVYAQLNNKTDFEISSYSYFGSEGDQNISLKKQLLENEVWNKIRVNPTDLPVGEHTVIPAFEYLRMSHREFKGYPAKISKKTNGEITSYQIEYQDLERILTINYTTAFPHTIESWTDTHKSGFGSNAKPMTTKAVKIKRLHTPYWQQNSNKFLHLKDSLGI